MDTDLNNNSGFSENMLVSGVLRGVWGFQPLPPPKKKKKIDKAEPNSQVFGKYICNNPIIIWV
jgi:hypothetical protein